MKSRLRRYYPLLGPAFLLLLLSGCASVIMTGTDPFRYEFTPVSASTFSEGEEALKAVVELLEDEGYRVARNSLFLTAVTEPEEIGYAYWRNTGEKWEIRYQIGVQLIRTIDDRLYWKLSHRILGSRSMREDRLFDPEDFAETERIFNDLILKVNNLFTSEI